MFRFVKLAVGKEWIPADLQEMMEWVLAQQFALKPEVCSAFMADLRGKKIADIAAEADVSEGTIWKRVNEAVMVLGISLKLRREYDPRYVPRLISVFDHEFGDEVDWIELSTCLYGKRSRSLFWYVRQAEAGKVLLSMPQMVDGRFLWTKKQAEEWRKFYVEH